MVKFQITKKNNCFIQTQITIIRNYEIRKYKNTIQRNEIREGNNLKEKVKITARFTSNNETEERNKYKYYSRNHCNL